MPEELYGSLEFPYEKAEVVRGTKLQGWTFSSSGKEVTVEIHLDGVKVKEIKMTVKRIQYQDVVVSAENGYDMPKTANELVSTVASMRSSPASYLNDDSWYYAEATQITEVDIIEED